MAAGPDRSNDVRGTDRAGEAGSGKQTLSAAEVFQGVMRATPAARFPELERDPLLDRPVMVYWPEDRLFYEGLVVALRHLEDQFTTAPPKYGEASPASEHLVLYDDGSSEWLDLSKERVRYPKATRTAQLCGQVVQSLVRDDPMGWFVSPVDAEALGLANYHDVVKTPMDLGTVDNRIAYGYYDRTPEDDEDDEDGEHLSPLQKDARSARRLRLGVARDVRLVFENAVAFNRDEGNPCASAARKLLEKFDRSVLGNPNKDPVKDDGADDAYYKSAGAESRFFFSRCSRRRAAGRRSDAALFGVGTTGGALVPTPRIGAASSPELDER